MANIKKILYLTLLLKIVYSEIVISDNYVDKDDAEKCFGQSRENLKNNTLVTTSTCSSVNSSFKRKNDKCCRVTISIDTLGELKKNFLKIGKEWLQIYIILMKIYQKKR